MVVSDDFGGVSAIMQWLSYVPKVSIRTYQLTEMLIHVSILITMIKL